VKNELESSGLVSKMVLFILMIDNNSYCHFNLINMSLILKTQNAILIACLGSLLSCSKNNPKKAQSNFSEEIKYKIYDSMIRVSNQSSGGGVVSENHYTANKLISIYKNQSTNELIYESDTFIVYQTTPITYSNKNGSFPLLAFSNDSISIYRHLSGVGLLSWVFLYGVKQ
jgi:hypothetical protein